VKLVIRLVAFIAFIAFVAVQMAAGFEGISHALGSGWAVAALFVALYWRFTLPITIGAFFGALQVWGWHWSLALAFTLPGLVFVLPGVIPAIMSLVTERSSAKLTRATPICAEH
jgi:hypothetical protein